jgi:pimeloyl-ACP methyl ester carboxylesterase
MMPPVYDYWVDNDGVRLHYLDSGGDKGLSIVIVPGVSESAEDYQDVIGSLPDIRFVVITFRGRGKSGAPKEGYSLSHHVSDIESVVEGAKLSRFCLIGVSRGVSYAVAFAIKHPEMIAGLVIGDYPPKHTRLPEGWADWFWTTSWLGRPVGERMAKEAVAGLQRESEDATLLDKLSSLDCPVLVLRGGQKGSVLTQEEAAKVRQSLKRAEVITFEQSGHNLKAPDYELLVNTILEFHARLK